ncbi:hypothetical protein [Geoalkalibacter sp.]|uniref:hypothetical protein n=1 Tax=Geoalkalibacter sp. TaxID=3041440 RepID=UPI00272E72A5|nr:hypothetical protein [Geoalkalibacter sp.]
MAVLILICALVFGAPQVRAASSCGQGEAAWVWTAPLKPRPGVPLDILAVAVDEDLTALWVTDPEGRRTPLPMVRGGGPPWSLRGILEAPAQGRYRVEAQRAGQVAACVEVAVGGGSGERGAGKWDLANQALYAAWIEHLFDAPPEASLNFASLEPVLRDARRNFLHNYLGQGDDRQVFATPDCADLPYILRAYFAWKRGLPVAYRSCTRGSATSPPRCEPAEIETTFTQGAASAEVFRQVSRRIMDRVHSGSGRTALGDDASDFYPVALKRAALWPGTLFADPYGHTLILVKWIAQTQDQPGLLLAVDAQPDNSVTRKRFWEGTFLFAATPSAGPGFKAYRAPLPDKQGWRQPLNRDLDGRFGLPAYSMEQAELRPEDFYARLEGLVNPQGLDPQAAYEATLAALMEQLETRVRSVDNGEAYMRAHPGTVVPMPRGPAIFETLGPWEDYSTPSRDMRLLIAMKVLDDLPARMRRHPELYRFDGEDPRSAAARIEELHAQRLQERFITYTRSDGSSWRLSLEDIYARRAALEIAYNPNDCVERRWGAAPGTPDFATCKRRAPAEQQARMEEYRPWFRETRRPPR